MLTTSETDDVNNVLVQWLSHVQFFCDLMDCSMPGFPVLHNLPEFAQPHEVVIPSNRLILCCSFFFLSSIFPSIRVFPNELALCIRWPECWSFSFSISSSNEYSGLDSFRIDWLALLAVQGTVKSLLQHHSSKASILQHSAFFLVQLSHPYITTGKTISLEEYEKMHLYSKGKLQKSHLQCYSISLEFCREILHVLEVTQLSALSPVVLPLMHRLTVLRTQACCIADSPLHVYLPFHYAVYAPYLFIHHTCDQSGHMVHIFEMLNQIFSLKAERVLAAWITSLGTFQAVWKKSVWRIKEHLMEKKWGQSFIIR